MAFKTKKRRAYRVGVWTKKGMPVQVASYNIFAKNEKEADKIGRKKIQKSHKKPRGTYLVATTGYGVD